MTENTDIQGIELPETLTIETIEAVAEDVRTLSLARPITFVVDAAKNDVITTPGIQLILSMSKTLDQAGGKLAITNAKPAFTQAFTDLGLSTALNGGQ